MQRLDTSPPVRSFTRRRALTSSGAAVAASMLGPAAASPAARAQATPAATPVAGTSAGGVTAERVAGAVAKLPVLADALLRNTGLPGLAVAVVYDDEVLLADGYGTREVGTVQPVGPDTVFQLASVSKSLAATTVAAVIGEAGVSWDARMADLMPSFALAEAWPTAAVTLTDLFSHRSGLWDHAGDLLEDLGFTQEQIIHQLRFFPPQYSFRAGYAYTNYGVTAAAEAVAQALGVAWPDLAEQRLYAPLGMTSTSSRFADYLDRADRAVPHVQRGGEWVVTPQQRDPDAQTPAGGVSSSVNDLAAWARMVLANGMFEGQTIIAPAALRPVYLPHAVANAATDVFTQRDAFYGLGTDINYTARGEPQWSHSGAFALGAGTTYYLLPAAGLGVIALGNGAPIGVPEILCLQLMDLAQNGTLTQDWPALVTPLFTAMSAPQYGTELPASPPADPAPSLALDAYAGSYVNPVFETVTITGGASGLRMAVGPAPMTFDLTHFNRDTFTWQPVGENAAGPSALTFTIGASNAAVSFRDDYFAWGGGALFTRSDESAPA